MDHGVITVGGIEPRQRLPHGVQGKPAGTDGQRHCGNDNKYDDGGQQPGGLLACCAANGQLRPLFGRFEGLNCRSRVVPGAGGALSALPAAAVVVLFVMERLLLHCVRGLSQLRQERVQ